MSAPTDGRDRLGVLGGDWRAAAVCAQTDPELFFPEADHGRAYEAQVAAAKRVCAGCPVCAQCLGFALQTLPYGVAGGLAPEERHGLLRVAASLSRLVELPASASRPEVAAAGREALRAGHEVAEVARAYGVTVRTVGRWAAQVRYETGAAA